MQNLPLEYVQTLGALIKTIRELYGIDRDDLSHLMGWSHTASLSNVEKDKRRLNKDKLLQLIERMGLGAWERTLILCAADEMPTDEELQVAHTSASNYLAILAYPGLLVTYRGEILEINTRASWLIDNPQEQTVSQSWLSCIIDPHSRFRQLIERADQSEWRRVALSQLEVFVSLIQRYCVGGWENTPTWIKDIRQSLANLDGDSGRTFRMLWNAAWAANPLPRTQGITWATGADDAASIHDRQRGESGPSYGHSLIPMKVEEEVLLFDSAIVPLKEEARLMYILLTPANDASLRYLFTQEMPGTAR